MTYFSICFRNAAEKAGFCVLRMIHEPSAAALAYGKNENLINITSIMENFYIWLN
jgi:molecular chaperone DnaK (HSP70)